jgi:hypothetical protein
LPFLLAKKEVFIWLKQGKKTIDIRKGTPKPGEIATFQSGLYGLKLRIVKSESGQLTEVIRQDNYRQVIPSAVELGDAFAYLRRLCGDYDGVFTAYYLAPL